MKPLLESPPSRFIVTPPDVGTDAVDFYVPHHSVDGPLFAHEVGAWQFRPKPEKMIHSATLHRATELPSRERKTSLLEVMRAV